MHSVISAAARGAAVAPEAEVVAPITFSEDGRQTSAARRHAGALYGLHRIKSVANFLKRPVFPTSPIPFALDCGVTRFR
jgi:hypothetical protein